jgi:acetyl esterase/lipase
MLRWFLVFCAAVLVCSSGRCEEKAGQGGEIRYGLKTDVFFLPQQEAEVTPYQREMCRLDVYYPENRPGFATLVWIHGGGLYGGTREIYPQLKNQEIAVVSLGYRLHPKVTCPAYIQDVAAGVAWTFRNIKQFGGDPDKVFVAGGSAGAYLTSMIGLDKRWLGEYGIDANRIAGLAALSGHAITHMTVRKEQGIADTHPVIDQYAPLNHLRADAPQILLVTGDRELEMLGRYEENAYFMRLLKLVGHKNVTLYELQGYDHGPVHLAAFLPMWRWVKKTLAERAQAETPKQEK